MSDSPNLKMTHDIIDYFVNKDIDFKMDAYRDDEDNRCIQFDFLVDGIPDFSIFYGIEDNTWSITSIYELLDPTIEENFNELKRMFKMDKGVFKDIMALDEDIESGIINEIHLHSEFEDSEFSLNKLDEIYEYLINKTEFIKELASISKE